MRTGFFLVFVSTLILFFIPIPSLQWIARSTLVLVGISYGYSKLIQKYLWVERGQETFYLYPRKTGEVTLVLTNYLPLPVPGVLLADEPGGLFSDGRERQILSLSPGEKRTLEYSLTPQDRGLSVLGPVTLLGSDPLGFFPWQKTLPLRTPVLVFPPIKPLAYLLSQGTPGGPVESTNPLHSDPNLVRSYREYQPGDDPRLISWKMSARTEHFQVAQFLQTLSAPGVILLNLSSKTYAGRRDFHHSERAIEAAASAVHFWIGLGESCALITNGTFPKTGTATATTPSLAIYPLGKGPSHANALLAALAVVQRTTSETETNNPTVELFTRVSSLQPGPGTHIIYIGPSPRKDEFLEGIQAFPRAWVIDLWVLDELTSYENKVAPGTKFPGRSVTCLEIRDQGELLE
ncbi:MAG: DUF58 domain-containing protein [Spirochaetales bacterium]|nr:DUF58 domain-containing protein [Spirochaetales bacterium]